MRILFIANYAPPINTSASIRTMYYIKYLAQLGVQLDILTTDYPSDFVNYDKSLEGIIEEYGSVYRVGLGNIYSKIYQRKKVGYLDEKKAPSKIRKFYNYKKAVKKFVSIPDAYFEWRKSALKVGEALIASNQYDCMFSMHEPPSSHLIAYNLKKKHKQIKWVGYWSDPWTDDPSRGYKGLRRVIENQLEKKVINNINKFLFTSENTQDEFMKKYNVPRNQTDIVFRGFEIEKLALYKKLQKPASLPNNKINIVYTGEIYHKIRDIKPLLQALKALRRENPSVYNKINVLFIGGIDSISLKKELEDYSCINLLGRMEFEECLRYLVHADFMLLLGNKVGGQIPGKIYDYMGIERPIISILGHDEDPVKPLVEKIDRGPIVNNNSKELYQMLVESVGMYKSNSIPYQWKKVNRDYEWKEVAKDLLRKIR